MSARPFRKFGPDPGGRVRTAAAILAWTLVWTAACATGRTARSGPRPVQLRTCGRVFVFVDHGRPAATIVIPEGAGETERQAAEILRTSILKMSGADLPVRTAGEPGRPGVAAIGFPRKDLPPGVASSLASLHPDGFLVTTSTGNLFVTGGSGKGVIYGVVHILEKYFGCRRQSLSAEDYPRRKDLALGCIFEVDNPVNEVRGEGMDHRLDR